MQRSTWRRAFGLPDGCATNDVLPMLDLAEMSFEGIEPVATGFGTTLG
jgi:hypothetical protein